MGLGLLGSTVAAGSAQAAPAPAAVLAAPVTALQTSQAALRQRIVDEARSHSGKRYRFGASGPGAFDCSGFTRYVYNKVLGKNLPHKANSQQRVGTAVGKSDAQPGDLIVIRSGSYGYHVGVYAGGGYMYDSPRPGKTVGKHKIWSRNYVVRRLV